MMEKSLNQFQEPFHNRERVNHGVEATKLIAEYFAYEERTSEEEKLLNGLRYGVEHGILSQDESDACMAAFLETRNGNQADQDPRTEV